MHSTAKDIIGNCAVFATVLQFLSGILVCKQYINNKTTAEASSLPFVLGILSSGMWLLYGLTKHDEKIILVNVIGVILMSFYTVIFYIYTFKKSTLLNQILIMVCFVTFVLGYFSTEENKELLLGRIGLLACSLTLLTVASPMSKLLYVLKVKNTECLPFPMILMSFFVSTLWYIYGIIIEDTYLQVQNFIGACLALSQLSLFVIYSNTAESANLGKIVMA